MTWPLWGLLLATPRLELTPDDDDTLDELVSVARGGVHPPDTQPFGSEWTDAADLEVSMRQHYWLRRAQFAPDRWTLNLVARFQGRVIGMHSLTARGFAERREVSCGLWLGSEFQGVGFGTEMSAAALLFAFDVLGADRAEWAALPSNAASLGVCRKLGFVENGSGRHAIRGERVDDCRFVLRPECFTRPGWTLSCSGLAGCLPLLGVES